MQRTLGDGHAFGFSDPARSRPGLADALGHDRAGVVVTVAIGSRALPHELREPRAEGTQRRAADRDADLSDGEVAATQQRLGALDAAGHQVAVGRLTVGAAELPGEVRRRHERSAGKGGHVERLVVVAIHQVARAAQVRQVGHLFGRHVVSLRLQRHCRQPCDCRLAQGIVSYRPVVVDRLFSLPQLAQLYDPLDPDRRDLAAYLAVLDELQARSVLDIGCGTGTFALLLARRGFSVIGVDPAQASLDVARAKPGSEAVRWVHGNAAVPLQATVDAVTMTGNVAQVFLHDDEWSAALRSAWQSLHPGGHLVFETRDP